MVPDWSKDPQLNEFGGNFGQIIGAAESAWRPSGGISRGALHFDGSTAVEMEGYAGAARSLAVSFWIRPASFQNATLAHKMDDAWTGKGWQLALKPDGAVEFQIGSRSNYSTVSAAEGYTPGQWVLVTAVYEGPGKKEKLRSRATLFINGEVRAVGCDLPQMAGAPKATLWTGMPFKPEPPAQPTGSGFKGEMDRFLIWAGELKRPEVAKLADFNAPTSIRLSRKEAGNFVEWILTGVDPDFEDDFDFELVPPTDGSAPHPVSIRGNVLTFQSLPPAGETWLITIRANDGTGRSVTRTFRFSTPPGTKPEEGGGGGNGGGGGTGGGGWDRQTGGCHATGRETVEKRRSPTSPCRQSGFRLMSRCRNSRSNGAPPARLWAP